MHGYIRRAHRGFDALACFFGVILRLVDPMVRIAITAEAFDAVVVTIPLGSQGRAPIWIDGDPRIPGCVQCDTKVVV